MVALKVHHVPDDVSRALAERALASGQTLQSFLLMLLTAEVGDSTDRALLEDLGGRADGSQLTTSRVLEALDEARAEREAQLATTRATPRVPGATPMTAGLDIPPGVYLGTVSGIESGHCTARIEVREAPGGCLVVDYEACSDEHGLQHVEHALVAAAVRSLRRHHRTRRDEGHLAWGLRDDDAADDEDCHELRGWRADLELALGTARR